MHACRLQLELIFVQNNAAWRHNFSSADVVNPLVIAVCCRNSHIDVFWLCLTYKSFTSNTYKKKDPCKYICVSQIPSSYVLPLACNSLRFFIYIICGQDNVIIDAQGHGWTREIQKLNTKLYQRFFCCCHCLWRSKYKTYSMKLVLFCLQYSIVLAMMQISNHSWTPLSGLKMFVQKEAIMSLLLLLVTKPILFIEGKHKYY